MLPVGGAAEGNFVLDLEVGEWRRGGFQDFFSKTTLGRNFFSLADFYSIFLDIWQNLVPDGCYGY